VTAPKRGDAFAYWWTREEWAIDKQTGYRAFVREPGLGIGWTWRVTDSRGAHLGEGKSTTQKGARAACRRLVRKLR
jgi:hypothetical protein